MTLVLGDYLWCRHLVQYFLECYEEEKLKSTDALAAINAILHCGLTIGIHIMSLII